MLPPEQERKQMNSRTLEQQLTDKFFEMQEAREEKNTEGADIVFDEKTKSIETMLRALPEAYESLMKKREPIDTAFIQERENIIYAASQATDAIQQQFIWEQKMEAAKWEYREMYEEIIMDVLQENHLVHMMRTPQMMLTPSQHKQEQPMPQEQQMPEEPVQQAPIEQQPVPQKPVEGKLSFFGRKKSPVNQQTI